MPDIDVNVDDIDTEYLQIRLGEDCLPTLNKEIQRLVAKCVFGFFIGRLSFERVEENGVMWIVLYADLGNREIPVYAEKLEDIYCDADHDEEK